MKQAIWSRVAQFLSQEARADALIQRSLRTPYMHLPSNEEPTYMERYWLFNPYDRITNKPKYWWCPWSVRIHHIKRADLERHQHDHPWNARTIILKGWYVERRENPEFESMLPESPSNPEFHYHSRVVGSTAKLGFGEYHSITKASPGGVWTLFISGPWRGVWGFLVNGTKVPWKQYLGIDGHPNRVQPKPAYSAVTRALEALAREDLFHSNARWMHEEAVNGYSVSNEYRQAGRVLLQAFNGELDPEHDPEHDQILSYLSDCLHPGMPPADTLDWSRVAQIGGEIYRREGKIHG